MKVLAIDSSGLVASAAIVEDDASGIDEITTNQRTDDGAIYNLNGQRVENPTKGVYIRNGKKILFR